MGRPQKTKVDYFPHYISHGKTLFILERKFGNDGYAFWFKLLEILGDTENHVYDCNNPFEWEFLLSKTHVNDSLGEQILETLSKLDAIDAELWQNRIIWCQNFVNNLEKIYTRRSIQKPSKPSLCIQKPHSDIVSVNNNPVSVNNNPQRKVKESKGKYSKEVLSLIKKSSQKILSEINRIGTEKGIITKNFKQDTHILARLREGYTEEDLLLAVNNVFSDDWHIETRKAVDLEYVFRKSKIDSHINMSPSKKHYDDDRPPSKIHHAEDLPKGVPCPPEILDKIHELAQKKRV